MLRALHHRGPDDHGLKCWPGSALVHTRLSILDLSPAGRQPMSNEDGTIWTVFNGEVYNHRELRADLEARGHRLASHSDTAVLPHLYEELGPDFLSRLRGMFALAVYDAANQRLLLARDRFGIKPLFFAGAEERLAFASEIPALLKVPGLDTRPDAQALCDFAALAYIPAPETFYRGIRALQPGELLEAQLQRDRVSWRTRRYHRWVIAPDPRLTLSDAAARADELLMTGVARQLESDVPLGTLLSGGIDSSLVSAAAQNALDGRLRTFNVRFSDSGYDETWAASAVATHIGSQHETLDMDGERGSWERITGLLRHAGQPYADTSIFAVNAVCRSMRRHVTVALSGDGGDEGFGGYNFYWQLGRISRWQAWPPPARRAGMALLDALSGLGALTRRLSDRVGPLNMADDTAIVQRLFSWVREEEQQRLCRNAERLPVRRLFEPEWEYQLSPNAGRLERLSAHATEVISRLTLPNDFLFKTDTASMKEGLELRVPMLDEDLFAFGLSLPHALKVKGRLCKRVLRRLAVLKLPRRVAEKPKRGFGVPLDTWVDDGFRPALRETLLGGPSKLPEFFHRSVYRPIVEAFCEDRPCPGISRQGLYQRAIMLLAAHVALETT